MSRFTTRAPIPGAFIQMIDCEQSCPEFICTAASDLEYFYDVVCEAEIHT